MSNHFLAGMLRHVRARSPRVAVRFNTQPHTLCDLADDATRYAAALTSLGITPGARVAVYLGTRWELIVAAVGHALAGSVHVPINPQYKGDEVTHILHDSGAQAVITDLAGGEVLDTLAQPLQNLPRVIVGSSQPLARPCIRWDDLLRAGGDAPSLDTTSLDGRCDDEVATLIYTSGTTGRSKGVAHTYRSWLGNIAALTTAWRWSDQDTLSLSLPLFHIHGLGLGVYGCLWHGATALAHPRFDAATVCDDFARRGATLFMGVPTMYRLLLDHLTAHPDAAHGLRSARLWTSGSAPLPAADHAQFKALTGHTVLERYGMSETMLTLSNPYDGERRAGAVGFPVPGGQVELVDEAGQPVADGEPGELRYKGDALMRGYWPHPTPPLDAQGWFRTGDIAARDPDGYIRILGRASLDIIKTGGYRVGAREVEEVILTCDLIREAAVVGVPDPKWGQRIEAVVVPMHPIDANKSTEIKDIITQITQKRLADYKRPRAVHIRDALPRNALGKVQKHLIIQNLTTPGEDTR
jgi:acyl-CoA synthetase (AMP-forming)/AMP-acid ligase II